MFKYYCTCSLFSFFSTSPFRPDHHPVCSQLWMLSTGVLKQSLNSFLSCPTGNRWQVPAPDDAQRRADGAVHKAGPRAKDLRVPREATANPAPQEQRLVAARGERPAASTPQRQSRCQLETHPPPRPLTT